MTRGGGARLGPVPVAVALACLLGAALAGVTLGPAHLPWRGVVTEVLSHLPFLNVESGLTEREATILWELRVPRVVLGGLVGATLASAGAAYQGVFRNPMADPYLLGVAAGAGLGATLAIAYGPNTTGWPVDLLPLAAFAGGVVGVLGAYVLGRSTGPARSTATLILAGVAMTAFLTAGQTYVQQQNAETLREVYAWILGRLGTFGWDDVTLILPYVTVSAVVILLHRRLLDVLRMGDEGAEVLGVNVGRVRIVVVLAATLGTAAAVAVSGLIGFVGIIVPHCIRLVAGSSYRRVVPLSLLLGAAFLIFADVLARTLTSPAELPIGVVTAFFGAPFFFVVLRTSRRTA